METAADHPTTGVPQAQSQWYDTKTTYQFWSSPKVDSLQLLLAIGRVTAQRAMDCPIVLILHDTANIGFSSSSAEGIDRVDRRVHVADREADIYELIVAPHQLGAELLIRATHNRNGTNFIYIFLYLPCFNFWE